MLFPVTAPVSLVSFTTHCMDTVFLLGTEAIPSTVHSDEVAPAVIDAPLPVCEVMDQE